MRWFIEVSRIGEDAPIEKYCLEAKQWQAALQEARKRRGDTGPLSKFSIELLEHGYRAVDPAQQIRYVVNKAPGDVPLSEPPPPGGAPPPGSFPAPGQLPHVESSNPVIVSKAHEQVPITDPMASSQLPSDPLASAPKTDPMAALPPESQPPNTSPGPPTAIEVSAAPEAQRRPVLTVPADEVPRPTIGSAVNATTQPLPAPVLTPPPPEPSAPAPAPVAAPPRPASAPPPSITQPSAPPSSVTQPMSPPAAAKPAPSPAQRTQRSIEAAREPQFQLIRKREEEPNDKVPITYREMAYAVRPGTERASAEVLLWLRFREVATSIKDRPAGTKFIQIAIFDHVFEKRPARPPIATLAWKDWRGDPVLQFPGTSQPPPPSAPAQSAPQHSAVPATAPSAPNPSTAAPVASAPVAPSAPPAQPVAPSAPPAPQPVAPSAPPPTSAQPVAPSAPPAPPAPSAPPAPPVAPSAPPPGSAQPVSAQPASFAGAPTEPPSTTMPSPGAGMPASVAPPTTPSAAPPHHIKTPPTAPIRRRAGEDLIGELFETMHDLHFAGDLMAGAEFVLGVLNRTLPSEAILIHIFDINTRHFIVVRALGPNSPAVVLHRTPDKEPLFRRAMRSSRSTITREPRNDPSYQDGRWGLLGVIPDTAILGPVQQAGRYLGAIELANPLGGEAYSEHEAHALDYICEQLAEFLAARPIVVDAEIVLGKG